MFASNYKLKYEIMFDVLCKIESENQFKKAKKFLRSKDLKISKEYFFYPKDLKENDSVFIYKDFFKEFCVCTNEGLNKNDNIVNFKDWQKLFEKPKKEIPEPPKPAEPRIIKGQL